MSISNPGGTKWCIETVFIRRRAFHGPRRAIRRAGLIISAIIDRTIDATDLPDRRSADLLLDMITDCEIWQAANAMIKRYGADAAGEAEFRADQLLVEGDADGYAIWRRISAAVEGL